jgi:hypothetical protein
MRRFKMTSFAAGAVFALVVGSGTAVAATGGKLILGHSNYATKTTGVKNSKGTALSLTSKAGTAPLKVSNTTKVAKLNADTVDGLDSSRIARTGARTGSFDVAGELVDADGNGLDDSIVAYAECPSGTQMTGGGVTDVTSTGTIVSNAPDVDGGEAWVVVESIAEDSGDTGDDVVASVVCYNPRGSVAGSYRVPAHRSATHLTPAMRTKLQRLATTR